MTPPVNDDDDDMDSSDEALCEILGLSSLNALNENNNNNDDPKTSKSHSSNEKEEDEKEDCRREQCRHSSSSSADKTTTTTTVSSSPIDDNRIPNFSDTYIKSIIQSYDLQSQYETDSVCTFPKELSIPSKLMRRLTDELTYGTELYPNVNRTYETIRILKNNGGGGGNGNSNIEERRVLTRYENFVTSHEQWYELCNGHLRHCVSALLGINMVLFKEKLNLKPPGGSGFAPHLDTPSLRIALGKDGPQSFVTVMVAIDDMTIKNGCLKVVRGNWTEKKHCMVVEPKDDGNPDGDGRAGAIEKDISDEMTYEELVVRGGTIVVFGGWTPHRSSPNVSPFSRRAVFLTYNPLSEGDYHDMYYDKMKKLRDEFRNRMGLDGRKKMLTEDEQWEMDALSSIPRI